MSKQLKSATLYKYNKGVFTEVELVTKFNTYYFANEPAKRCKDTRWLFTEPKTFPIGKEIKIINSTLLRTTIQTISIKSITNMGKYRLSSGLLVSDSEIKKMIEDFDKNEKIINQKIIIQNKVDEISNHILMIDQHRNLFKSMNVNVVTELEKKLDEIREFILDNA